jgi:hypothetical protein
MLFSCQLRPKQANSACTTFNFTLLFREHADKFLPLDGRRCDWERKRGRERENKESSGTHLLSLCDSLIPLILLLFQGAVRNRSHQLHRLSGPHQLRPDLSRAGGASVPAAGSRSQRQAQHCIEVCRNVQADVAEQRQRAQQDVRGHRGSGSLPQGTCD